MNPVVGYALLLGLAGVIGCVWILASKIDSHMRETTQILIDSNEMILARLDRLASVPEPDREVLAAALLERTDASFGQAASQLGDSSIIYRRAAGRRREDALPAS